MEKIIVITNYRYIKTALRVSRTRITMTVVLVTIMLRRLCKYPSKESVIYCTVNCTTH